MIWSDLGQNENKADSEWSKGGQGNQCKSMKQKWGLSPGI